MSHYFIPLMLMVKQGEHMTTHTHTPRMCTPAGVRGVQGAQYLAVVAMGNRGRGGGGGWGSGTVGATLYSPSRCSHIIKHT